MEISATVVNQDGRHQSMVRTGDKAQSLAIPAKTEGFGSAVNGGELLFLALATCYCNDIYREAKARGMDVESIEVQVAGRFGARGSPPRTSRIEHRSKHKEAKEKCLISCGTRTPLRRYTIR